MRNQEKFNNLVSQCHVGTATCVRREQDQEQVFFGT